MMCLKKKRKEVWMMYARIKHKNKKNKKEKKRKEGSLRRYQRKLHMRQSKFYMHILSKKKFYMHMI